MYSHWWAQTIIIMRALYHHKSSSPFDSRAVSVIHPLQHPHSTRIARWDTMRHCTMDGR